MGGVYDDARRDRTAYGQSMGASRLTPRRNSSGSQALQASNQSNVRTVQAARRDVPTHSNYADSQAQHGLANALSKNDKDSSSDKDEENEEYWRFAALSERSGSATHPNALLVKFEVEERDRTLIMRGPRMDLSGVKGKLVGGLLASSVVPRLFPWGTSVESFSSTNDSGSPASRTTALAGSANDTYIPGVASGTETLTKLEAAGFTPSDRPIAPEVLQGYPSLGEGGKKRHLSGDASSVGASKKKPAPGIADGSFWVATSSMTSVDNAQYHWEKHKSEFPEYQEPAQYFEGVRSFVSNPLASVLTKRRPNGDILLYDRLTNTFAVKTKEGLPRSMFRPQDKMRYWNKQS